MKKLFLLLILLAALMCAGAMAETYGDFEYTVDENGLWITKYTGSAENLTVPDAINGIPVSHISPEAFRGNTALRSITLPDSLQTIDRHAFSDCTNIRSMTVPDGVTKISLHCMDNMTSLEELTLPAVVEGEGSLWGNSAFSTSRPVNLRKLTITSGSAIVADQFRLLPALETVILADSITSIDLRAFYMCSALKTVELPEHLLSIGNSAFANTALTEIRIPDSVTSIDPAAFINCASLTSVHLPEGLTGIAENTFSGCKSLRSINFPGTLKSIGKGAFWDCKLSSVRLPEGLETLGEAAFYTNALLVDLYIPGSVKTISKDAFYNCYELKNLTLSEGIETIDASAFYNCYNLADIHLPDTLKTIRTLAFEFTACTHVILPRSLTTLEEYSFGNDQGRSITVYTNPAQTSITGYAFGQKPKVWCVKDSAAHAWYKKEGKGCGATLKLYGDKNGVLELRESEVILGPGKSYTIPVAFANSVMSLSFESSNPAIASVNDDGVITTHASGSAEITISGGGKSAVFTVHVMLPIDSFRIDFKEITVSVGDAFYVPMKVYPESAASAWRPASSSSNASVAAAEGYTVSALQPGIAVITFADPSDSSKSLRLTVNVAEDTIHLPGNAANIRDEAFMAIHTACISVPANVQTIGAHAFADNAALKLVRLDGKDTSIDETAFDGCSGFMFLCIQNSAPHAYAQQHGIPCVFIP